MHTKRIEMPKIGDAAAMVNYLTKEINVPDEVLRLSVHFPPRPFGTTEAAYQYLWDPACLRCNDLLERLHKARPELTITVTAAADLKDVLIYFPKFVSKSSMLQPTPADPREYLDIPEPVEESEELDGQSSNC